MHTYSKFRDKYGQLLSKQIKHSDNASYVEYADNTAENPCKFEFIQTEDNVNITQFNNDIKILHPRLISIYTSRSFVNMEAAHSGSAIIRSINNYTKYHKRKRYSFFEISCFSTTSVKYHMIDCKSAKYASGQLSVHRVLNSPEFRFSMKCTDGDKELASKLYEFLCRILEKKELLIIDDDDDSDDEEESDSSEDTQDEEDLIESVQLLQEGDMWMTVDPELIEYGICESDKIRINVSEQAVDVYQRIQDQFFNRIDQDISEYQHNQILKHWQTFSETYVFFITYKFDPSKTHSINRRRRKALNRYNPPVSNETATITFLPRCNLQSQSQTRYRAVTGEANENNTRYAALREIAGYTYTPRNFSRISSRTNFTTKTNKQNMRVNHNDKFANFKDEDRYVLSNTLHSLQRPQDHTEFNHTLLSLTYQCASSNNATETYQSLCTNNTANDTNYQFLENSLLPSLCEVGMTWNTTIEWEQLLSIFILIQFYATLLQNSPECRRDLLQKDETILQKFICTLFIIYFKCLDVNMDELNELDDEELENFVEIYQQHANTKYRLLIRAIEKILRVLLQEEDKNHDASPLLFTDMIEDLDGTLLACDISEEVIQLIQTIVKHFGYEGYKQCFIK